MQSLKKAYTYIASAKVKYLRARQTSQGQLTVRRIFFLPTATGWSYLAATLIILALAINFSAIPGYLLAFLVASMLIVSMPLGLRNIVKLRLSIAHVEPAFFGSASNVNIKLQNTYSRDRYSVLIEYEKTKDGVCVDIAGNSVAAIDLPFTSASRGSVSVPALRISTVFPLGLMKVSAFWAPEAYADVFCAPEEGGPTFQEAISSSGADNVEFKNDTLEDFSGVRKYEPGDRPRDLAWRQIAKFGGYSSGSFFTKTFDSEQGPSRLFCDHHLSMTLTLEEKLSRLTAWVIEAESENVQYGLDCLSLQTDLGSGYEHKSLCLRLIAQCEEENSK